MATEQTTRRAAPEGMRSRIQRTLKLSPLFERASKATRESAIAAGEIDLVPGGTVVIRQGTAPTALVVMGRGRARIERTSGDGRIVPLGYRGSGEILSESCLAQGALHEENATAMEEVEY